MTSQQSFLSLLRRAALPAIVLGLGYYLAYNLIEGDRGLIAWLGINQELDADNKELERLKAERMALEKKVSLLRPDHLDPDMLDERSRAVLGLAEEDELVIFLDEPEEE